MLDTQRRNPLSSWLQKEFSPFLGLTEKKFHLFSASPRKDFYFSASPRRRRP